MPFLTCRTAILLLVVSASAYSTRTAQSPDSEQQQQIRQKAESITKEHNKPPVSRLVAEPSGAREQALRINRSRRYNGPSHIDITKLVDGGRITRSSEFSAMLEIPPIPLAKSKTILIADVLSTQAYLSSDKTTIYTEYSLAVQQVLRNDPAATTHADAIVTACRKGGTLILPNGNTVGYDFQRQGFPGVGERYLFFLDWDSVGEDYQIVTAYLFLEGQVYPIDDLRHSRTEDLRHAGEAIDSFVAEVEKAVAICEGSKRP